MLEGQGARLKGERRLPRQNPDTTHISRLAIRVRVVMTEAVGVNILDSESDAKGCHMQTTQFIFGILLSFVTHLLFEVLDQVVKFALDAVGFLLKQGDTSVQNSLRINVLLMKISAVAG